MMRSTLLWRRRQGRSSGASGTRCQIWISGTLFRSRRWNKRYQRFEEYAFCSVNQAPISEIMKQNDNQDAEKQLEMVKSTLLWRRRQRCPTGASGTRCQIWDFWKLFSGPAGENRRYQRLEEYSFCGLKQINLPCSCKVGSCSVWNIVLLEPPEHLPSSLQHPCGKGCNVAIFFCIFHLHL